MLALNLSQQRGKCYGGRRPRQMVPKNCPIDGTQRARIERGLRDNNSSSVNVDNPGSQPIIDRNNGRRRSPINLKASRNLARRVASSTGKVSSYMGCGKRRDQGIQQTALIPEIFIQLR